MSDIDKDKLFNSIKTSFDSESRKDIVDYFSFLAGEINNILSGCEEKKEALITLRNYQNGKLEDDTEMKKLFPDKEKTDEAIAKLENDLAELEKEFDIVETLFNSIIAEAKNRLSI